MFRLTISDPDPTTGARGVRVDVDAQLIVGTRQELKQKILDALAELTRPTRVVLDFTGCAYIDSSGLGVLVSLNKKCREAGTRLVLVGLNEDLRTLFHSYHLDDLFVIEQKAAA